MAKFVVYEKVVEAVYKRVEKSKTSDGMQTVINLGSGLVAGCAAAIVSQPADTMLSKINKTKGLPGEGTISRLIKIGGELGLRGSFSGIGARLVMVGTLTAGQFAIYGDIKKALGRCSGRKSLMPKTGLTRRRCGRWCGDCEMSGRAWRIGNAYDSLEKLLCIDGFLRLPRARLIFLGCMNIVTRSPLGNSLEQAFSKAGFGTCLCVLSCAILQYACSPLPGPDIEGCVARFPPKPPHGCPGHRFAAGLHRINESE